MRWILRARTTVLRGLCAPCSGAMRLVAWVQQSRHTAWADCTDSEAELSPLAQGASIADPHVAAYEMTSSTWNSAEDGRLSGGEPGRHPATSAASWRRATENQLSERVQSPFRSAHALLTARLHHQILPLVKFHTPIYPPPPSPSSKHPDDHSRHDDGLLSFRVLSFRVLSFRAHPCDPSLRASLLQT